MTEERDIEVTPRLRAQYPTLTDAEIKARVRRWRKQAGHVEIMDMVVLVLLVALVLGLAFVSGSGTLAGGAR